MPTVLVVVSSLLRCKTQDLRLQSLGTALLVEGLELILCKLKVVGSIDEVPQVIRVGEVQTSKTTQVGC